MDEIRSQLQTLRLNLADLVRERDFYLGKLRDIAFICEEEGASSGLAQRILAIVYATAVRQIGGESAGMACSLLMAVRQIKDTAELLQTLLTDIVEIHLK